MRKYINVASYLCLLILVSCKPSFEPIEYGKDACANCKMTIVDARFASEVVTGKGRVYKFDDVLCMKQYLDQNEADPDAQYYVANYINSEATMLDAENAVFLEHEAFRSPMNGNYAAFAGISEARSYSDSLEAITKDWNSIK